MYVLILEIAIQALVLCAVLYVVARHEADYSFDKVFMVAAGIALGNLLIGFAFDKYLGPFTIVAQLAFVVFMLKTFCWVSTGKAAIVTIVFGGFVIAMTFVTGIIQKSIEDSVAGQMSAVDERERDMQEAKQMMMEAVEGPYQQPAVETVPDGLAPTQYTAGEYSAPEVVEKIESGEMIPSPAPSAGPESAAENWAEARKQLSFGGTVGGQNKEYLALVNGRPVGRGETVFAEYGGKIYRWQVRSVSKSGIDLEQLDVRPK